MLITRLFGHRSIDSADVTEISEKISSVVYCTGNHKITSSELAYGSEVEME